jgi:lipoprotein-anchoring transpeptidase ErfK/SrfK
MSLFAALRPVAGAIIFLFEVVAAPSTFAQGSHAAPLTASASALPREQGITPVLEQGPPGFEVAHVVPGHVVRLRLRPEGPVAVALDAVTEFGSPQTFSVVTRKGPWLGVRSSALPNRRLGWLAAGRSLRLTRTSVRLAVDLSRRRLFLIRRGRVVRTIAVGIGRSSSPTPIGRFAVTDKLAGSHYGSYYGCCILVLSAHQPNLAAGWRGGDRIAIHGTTDPSSIGAAVSAGCAHARDTDLRVLFRLVPLGAPVIVRS